MAMLNDRSSVLALLKSRKSASAKAMTGPGPEPEILAQIISIAVRAPDHGKLAPWRFIRFDGDARKAMGDVFAARWQALNPAHGAETVEAQRGLFLRAPVVVVVVSTAAPHVKIPEWEQVLSAGAVCQNILLACAALGVGCQWNSGWIAYDGPVTAAMGLQPHEKVAGIMYFGTSAVELEDRPRPDAAAITTIWGK